MPAARGVNVRAVRQIRIVEMTRLMPARNREPAALNEEKSTALCAVSFNNKSRSI
jgi:hypothetical protein